MEWLPIESAPKDGAVILARGRGEYGPADYVVPVDWPESPQLVRWAKTGFAPDGAWTTQKVSISMEHGNAVAEPVLFDATHWQPLPPPPGSDDEFVRIEKLNQDGSVE